MDFFEEFQKLRQKVPRISLRGYKNVNSEYIDYVYFSKNSYLCFAADLLENCMYCMYLHRNKFCVDCYYVTRGELCYECVNCDNCYNSDYLQDCRDSNDCFLGYDLLHCNNCFGCTGLRHKSFHIFNEPKSEEEYKAEVKELRKKPIKILYQKLEEVRKKHPHLYSFQYKTENCTGDHLNNCQNTFYSFDCEGLQDCQYMYGVYNVYGERSTDSCDCFFSVDLQHCYQTMNVGKGYNVNFCSYCENVRDCEYCDSCFNSEYLFGCVGLNRRKYCILNKEFEPQEWEKRVSEIKSGMRESGQYGKWPLSEGEKFDC